MPFLRPVASAGTGVSTNAVEIRSSTTLIGSGQSKCDVVLPAERGVLDLHALFNLSTTDSAATLVPFSATTDGACFLNGRLVPAQGATVVHGDKVAFGNADNAFVFTVSDPSTKSSMSQDPRSLENSRSFRRTLDALRGDRAPVVSASQNVSTSKKREPAAKPVAASGSRDRLEKFLLDASTDSLLGDYVERKLRASTGSTGKPRRGQRPTAMEPPPSLSASSVSSLRSSLTDSILDRSALERARESSSAARLDTLEQSQSLLSTAERNYAEIEKLRLSQRLREVNSVLNGHLNFDSSYLMKERRSSGSGSMRFASPLKSSLKRLSEKTKSAADTNDQSEEEQNEEDDDLPAMVEKPRSKMVGKPDTVNSRETAPSVKSSIASLLSSSLTGKGPQAIGEPSDEKDDDAEVALDESLPSFSEAILKQQPAAKAAEPVTHSMAKSSQSVVDPLLPSSAKGRVRTQLHQQLIDRTLHQKRQEILSEGFIRWRRGLRIQQQRRRDNAQQQRMVAVKLTLLRRNQMFTKWKHYTERKQQVRQCREEALAQRQQSRLIRSVWVQWRASTVRGRQRRQNLRRLVVALGGSRLREGFQRWRRHSDKQTDAILQHQACEDHRQVLDKRMEGVAARHYQLRVKNAAVARVFRVWRTMVKQTHQKKRVLQRMLQLVFRRCQLRAWTTWQRNTVMKRQAIEAENQRRTQEEDAKRATGQQLKEQQTQLETHHGSQINELRGKIEELQRQLHAHEKDQQDKRKQAAAKRAQAKAQWNESLERLLEKSIAQADARIADVSTRLERLLQQMDAEPEAARFQAATFLVESMLEQKLRLVNERVQAHEGILQATGGSSSDHESGKRGDGAAWKKTLTSNARFLLDMVHQRQARLHQLYHAVAKLAATVVDITNDGGGVRTDAARFKHAAFLTDTMNERAIDHIDTLLSIQYRRCELGLVEATNTASGEREARKY